MSLWLKNTSGKRDAVLTMATLGFLLVCFKVLLNGVSITFDGNTYEFGNISSGEIAAILTPTLGAYVSRRYTDKKFDGEVKDEKSS